MTLALDHSPDTTVRPLVARLVRAIRARAAEFHHYWLVECVEPPSDPFASLSSREQWDLPVWHPDQPED